MQLYWRRIGDWSRGLRLGLLGPGPAIFKLVLGKFAAREHHAKRGTSATSSSKARRVPTPDTPCWWNQGASLPAIHLFSSARRTSDDIEALSRVRRKGWPNRPLCALLAIAEAARALFVQLATRHPRKTDCGPFHTGHAEPDRCKVQAVRPARNLLRRPVHTVVSITFLSFNMDGKVPGAGDYPPTMSISRLPSACCSGVSVKGFTRRNLACHEWLWLASLSHSPALNALLALCRPTDPLRGQPPILNPSYAQARVGTDRRPLACFAALVVHAGLLDIPYYYSAPGRYLSLI